MSDDEGEGITYGLTGTELLLCSDLRQAALDAYSVVWEPSRKLMRDHQAATFAAVAAAILRLAAEHGDPSMPTEFSEWLRRTGLQLDPEVETRGD